MKTARPTATNTYALLTPVPGLGCYVLHGWFPTLDAAFAYARRRKLTNACVPCISEAGRDTPAELETRLAPWLSPTVQK